MKENKIIPKNIDEYISMFPENTQATLQKLRQTIHKAAPDAEEAMSYQMPTFRLKGNLVHFAAYKNHIGFYPTPSGIEAFSEELSGYEQSKGAVRFPPDKVPFNLISKIVKFRVKENLDNKKKTTTN